MSNYAYLHFEDICKDSYINSGIIEKQQHLEKTEAYAFKCNISFSANCHGSTIDTLIEI